MDGTPYNMNDPAWLVNVSDQNRSIFAYKIFSSLLMLGYQTEIAINGLSSQIPHLLALYAFQNRNGLPKSDYVDSECLVLLDQQLLSREQEVAAAAQRFQLRDHMQPLHPNDISPDTLAAIYATPLQALPKWLRMSLYEEVQCINGQCNGFIQGADGGSLPWPIDLNADYRFVGAYFDRLKGNSRLPSAAVHVQTVLHEYAHYLDGYYKVYGIDPLMKNFKRIDTTGFYAIGYDLSSGHNGCYTPKSTNPQDWVTKYAAQLPGYGGCANGATILDEDWAESFSMYVASARDFRAAAAQSSLIAQKYDWIKEHVFAGLEYDTDLVRGTESGCNDVYLYGATGVPGYAHCNNNYVWDFTLPQLQSTIDTTPSAPAEGAFAAETNVALSTPVISNSVAVSGINWTSPVSISGGEYAINGGAFTTLAGTVENGDQITIRQTSAASFSTRSDAVLTIGGTSATFSVTTRAPFQVTIGGTPALRVLVGAAYAFVPTSANATGFSVGGTLPPGLQFNTATGALSGTPATAGSYGPINITAHNGALSASLTPFSIDVIAPTGTFAATGALATGRQQPTVILLSTGKVLAAGGYDDTTTLASAELYDPADGSWHPAAAMTGPRGDHSTTLLPNGMVLVAGGYDAAYNLLASAELYDPVADDWVAATAMQVARSGHSATLLPSGKVLVVGGSVSAGISASAELYDPATDSWQTLASMRSGRTYHTATLLANGKLLVTGGYDENWEPTATCELYDPAQDRWIDAAPLADPRANHSASLLGDGTVLVAGGDGSSYAAQASVERYAPAGDAWSVVAPLSASRSWHVAVLLADGRLLTAGGKGENGNLATAEVFDPTGGTWQPTGAMAEAQAYAGAALLTNGQVLLVGGSTGTAYATTQAQLFTAGTVPDFTVTFASGGNGSLGGVAVQRIMTGGRATSIVATSAPGYQFVNWTGTGSFTATTANPLTISPVTEDLTVTANFAPLPVNGSCGASNGGTFGTPPIDLCANGTSSTLSGNGPWSWTCAGISGGSDASCSANATTWAVRITITGTGAGTVTSQPAGISCTSDNSTGCSASFTVGTTITLQAATPDAKSSFQGWSGDCGGNGACVVAVTGDRDVAANFISNTRVRVTGGMTSDHLTLQDAYDNVPPGAAILSQATTFREQLVLGRNIAVRISGGKDAGYQTTIGTTTLSGSLTIVQGSLDVDGVIVQ